MPDLVGNLEDRFSQNEAQFPSHADNSGVGINIVINSVRSL